MNVDIYIFLRFVVIFSEFFKLSISVLHVSPDTDLSHQDRSVSVPAESAAETANVNHEMVGFVLTELGGLLDQVGLYQVVRAVQYGIPQSSQNFFRILEHYNLLTGTFFTPFGEMGLALHKLYEVSGLIIGDAPYEEYVPTSEELHFLKKECPRVYETYWEVLCHFHICGQITSWRTRGVKQMSWASYLLSLIHI